jgi:hypothetical protein
MRNLLDNQNQELQLVLDALMVEDVTITVREVARRHPRLKNASAFTRNAARTAVIVKAQQLQETARRVRLGPATEQVEAASTALEKRDEEVAKLQSQVDALVASHAACVRAVLNHGGMAALERFWIDYKGIADELRALKAIPQGGTVVELPQRQ